MVRADGNAQIGYGHIMRCLSIVKGGHFKEVHWFSKEEIAASIQEESPSIEFHIIGEESDFHKHIKKKDTVLMDGYSFSWRDHQKIISFGAHLILIDDLADKPIMADIVINPAPGFDATCYKTGNAAIILTGLNYALLRPPLLALAKKNIRKKPNSVLICMGGSDPKNVTEKTLEAASKESFTTIHVVLGSGYRYQSTLEHFKDERITFHSELSAQEMADLMADCEWGIYPSSGMLVEGLAAQQGILAGITAENQRMVYEGHKQLDSIIDCGQFSADELKKAFKQMATWPKKKQLIDGCSVSRIHQMINRLWVTDDFTARTATDRDLEQTFKWAQDPSIRKFSFQQNAITLQEHTEWFLRKLNDTSCYYYLIEDKKRPIGSVRFDIQDGDALISYLLDSSEHGKGFGLFLLKKGMDQLSKDHPEIKINQFVGDVMPENSGSVRIFEYLGFQKETRGDFLRFTKKNNHEIYH
jgi:UDP-2,4-diacetamido-2,4,6-trideoxy-beta-L-altropyranose hydrolase